MTATPASTCRIERNWDDGDPGFRAPEKGKFQLGRKSPVLTKCFFEPLPLERMVLYNDPLRASWPVHHPSGNYETLYVDTSVITQQDRKPIDKMPVCRAQKATAPIRIDGVLLPEEWGGLRKDDEITLTRNPANMQTKAKPSTMWLRRDDENLYIAIKHRLEPGHVARPRNQGESWWGEADMVEAIFEGGGDGWWPANKGHGPIFYLTGDCNGNVDSHAIAGLPQSRADGLKGAVEYAAAREGA